MSGRLRPRPGSVKRQAGTKIIAVQDDPAAPHGSPVYRGFATTGRHADCRDEPLPNPLAARIRTNRTGIFFAIHGWIRFEGTRPKRPRRILWVRRRIRRRRLGPGASDSWAFPSLTAPATGSASPRGQRAWSDKSAGMTRLRPTWRSATVDDASAPFPHGERSGARLRPTNGTAADRCGRLPQPGAPLPAHGGLAARCGKP